MTVSHDDSTVNIVLVIVIIHITHKPLFIENNKAQDRQFYMAMRLLSDLSLSERSLNVAS